MKRRTWIQRSGWLAGFVLAVVIAGAACAQVDVQVQAAPVALSEWWIGLSCQAPIPEAVRAQSGLKENQGVLVEAVFPESPAAKAGLQQHDILLKAGGKPLGKVQDLIDAIDAAKDKPLALELLRGGKPLSIEVKPEKRPASAQPGLVWPPGADWDQMRKWIERMRPGERGGPPLRFRFFHPGTILPPSAATMPPLPDNMSVVITKQGKEPAHIVVKKDSQKWEITEKELDKLPADVRPHVEQMLGRGWREWSGRLQFFDFFPDWTPEASSPAAPETPSDKPPPSATAPSSRLERRLESLERRVEQLRKSLDEMRQAPPRPKAPESKPEKI